MIALGGRVRSAGKDGERVDSVEDLLASGLGERLVLEVEFDEPRRSGHAAVRRPHAHAYTILAVCVAETADGIRVGLSGAGPHGIRARSVEDALANGDGADDVVTLGPSGYILARLGRPSQPGVLLRMPAIA